MKESIISTDKQGVGKLPRSLT